MKKAFTREDIVEAAFQVVRKDGKKNLSARTIAKELKASTMPIYSTISSMKELEREMGQKFTELFLQYATTPWTNNFLVDMCFGYVRFAREEKVLFRIMFLDDEPAAQADYETQKPIVLASLWEQLKADPTLAGLDKAQVQHIIDNMEIIIHGLACLINFGRLPDESDEYIIRYLEEVSTFFVEREKNQPSLGGEEPKTMNTNASIDEAKWYAYTSSTQTMRTWVKQLNSIEEIPPMFRDALPPDTATPYLLFIPEDRHTLFLQRTPQILAVYDHHFVLLQLDHGKVKAISAPFSEVLYLERGKILLYSWLSIKTDSDSVSIKFNTTNEMLFEPVIGKIRRGMNKPDHPEEIGHQNRQQGSPFDSLEAINYKYMNYGRQSVRPGDTVAEMIHQPARVVQEFNLFGKPLFKRYATEHLSILTGQELILIKESKHIKTAKEALYGGVFTYIPQHRITGITFAPDEKNSTCSMQINLPQNIRLTSEFSLDNPQLEKFRQIAQK